MENYTYLYSNLLALITFVCYFLGIYIINLRNKIWFKKNEAIINFCVILLIFLTFNLGAYLQSTKGKISDEEKEQLSPKVHIKLFSYLDEAALPPYKYPLKQYVLMIQNLNENSASIFDFRIKLIFNSVINEVKQSVSIKTHDDNQFGVRDIKVYGLNKNNTEPLYEEQPLDTSLTKNFSLNIQKANIKGKEANTNIVILNCSRWPEKTSYSADIIIDLTKKPEMLRSDIGTYEGIYFYEIKGKRFSQKISGFIPFTGHTEYLFTSENRPYLTLEPEKHEDTCSFLKAWEDGKDVRIGFRYKLHNIGTTTAITDTVAKTTLFKYKSDDSKCPSSASFPSMHIKPDEKSYIKYDVPYESRPNNKQSAQDFINSIKNDKEMFNVHLELVYFSNASKDKKYKTIVEHKIKNNEVLLTTSEIK